MHPLCSCESLQLSICLSAYPPAGIFVFLFSFLCLDILVSLLLFPLTLSLLLPLLLLLALYSPLFTRLCHRFSHWALLSHVVSVKGSEETQSFCTALQPVATFFTPHIHPDTGLCDITRGLNPQAPPCPKAEPSRRPQELTLTQLCCEQLRI